MGISLIPTQLPPWGCSCDIVAPLNSTGQFQPHGKGTLVHFPSWPTGSTQTCASSIVDLAGGSLCGPGLGDWGWGDKKLVCTPVYVALFPIPSSSSSPPPFPHSFPSLTHLDPIPTSLQPHALTCQCWRVSLTRWHLNLATGHLWQQPCQAKWLIAFCNNHKEPFAAGRIILATQCLTSTGPKFMEDKPAIGN